MNSAYFETGLLKKEHLASDIFAFHFQKPKSFSFIAGQYIRIYLDIPNPDERGNSRPLSLVSKPNEPTLTVTTRMGISSFKNALFSIKEKTTVKIFGPLGGFVLKPEIKTHVFLAGGIGITPIRSIILDVFERNKGLSIYLFTSFKTPDEVVFAEDFDKVKIRNSSFQFIQTISRPEESTIPWFGETGRITAEMVKKYVSQPSQAYYYISGPISMVDGLFTEVTNLGVAKEQIIKEKFTGY